MEDQQSGSSNEDNLPDQTLHTDACNILDDLRKEGQLTDAVIKAGNQTFPIHRPVLLACSNYFRALFTNESFNTSMKELVIPGVSGDMMAVIIEYAYTQKVKVTAENVEYLLPVADQFHVTGIVKECCDFLSSNLTPENCIGIYKFAKSYFCHGLEETSRQYLMHNFNLVHQRSNELLQLCVDEVYAILSSEELNVKSEEAAFEAAVRWVDYDPCRRKNCMPKLLRGIRLGLLPTEYFVEKVKAHEYVKDSEMCKPIVVETLKLLYDLDLTEGKDIDLAHPLAKPRVPHEVLFVIGGWSGGSPTNLVETYDSRADRWIVICEALDTGPRAYHGTASVGHQIYIIGGFDGTEYFNTVRSFDPVHKTWSERAPMHSKRCYVSVAVLNGTVFAMGGFNGDGRHNSAEKYNPETNQWTFIAFMNMKRSDAGATTLNDRVYICGGFNGSECLISAECYNPYTDQWTLLPNMESRRSGIGVIAYRDHIYAVGGFNGVSRLKTGEMYDPKTDRWRSIPDMYHPRSNFAIEVVDEMLFAIGGFDGTSTIFNVECYDDVASQWYDATDMNLYRSALSACVVSGLPNIQDYTHKVQPTSQNGDDQTKKTSTSTS